MTGCRDVGMTESSSSCATTLFHLTNLSRATMRTTLRALHIIPRIANRPSSFGFTSFGRRAMSSEGRPLLLERPVKLACVQLASGADKAANLAHARDKVREAAAAGAK